VRQGVVPDEPALAEPDLAASDPAVDESLAEPSEDETLPVEELAAKYDLPNPETLETEDQVAPFLGDGVPERLKRLALRRVWRLNPVFANVDGLVDYGEDYTDAATVVANLATVFRVGKGAAPDIDETEPEAIEPTDEAEPDAAQASIDSIDSEAAAPEVQPTPEAPVSERPDEAPHDRVAHTSSEPPPPRPRRMVFRRPAPSNDGD